VNSAERDRRHGAGEGGDGGGQVVAQGTPEQIARNPKSDRGAYLKPVLARTGAKRSAAE